MANNVLFFQEDIENMVKRVAVCIIKRYGEEEIVLVALLAGAVVFAVDLSRAIQIRRQTDRLKMEYLKVSSYGDGQSSSGIAQIEGDIESSIKGKHVIIVDDVAETRLTLNTVCHHLKQKQPASISTCVAVDKTESNRFPELILDFVGFSNVRGFLVGYGMDNQGESRFLPYITRIT